MRALVTRVLERVHEGRRARRAAQGARVEGLDGQDRRLGHARDALGVVGLRRDRGGDVGPVPVDGCRVAEVGGNASRGEVPPVDPGVRGILPELVHQLLVGRADAAVDHRDHGPRPRVVHLGPGLGGVDVGPGEEQQTGDGVTHPVHQAPHRPLVDGQAQPGGGNAEAGALVAVTQIAAGSEVHAAASVTRRNASFSPSAPAKRFVDGCVWLLRVNPETSVGRNAPSAAATWASPIDGS